jgi:hypothetical protein
MATSRASNSAMVDCSASKPSTQPIASQRMEVEDISEGNEEEDSNFNEDQLCQKQKLNAIYSIQDMCITPRESSRFNIPLCRMVYMPLVRPTLVLDIKRLEAKFTHGYRIGANVFYVSLTNEKGEERIVPADEKEKWGALWNEENEKFEKFLRDSSSLSSL